jgi:subtilisin family serine protease
MAVRSDGVFDSPAHVSASLLSFIQARETGTVPRVATTYGYQPVSTHSKEGDLGAASVIVGYDPNRIKPEELQDLGEAQELSNKYVSLRLPVSNVAELVSRPGLTRIQTKKTKTLSIDRATAKICGAAQGLRHVHKERGGDVLVGIVDTGCDLTHPAFKGRVVAYLDQEGVDSVWRRGDPVETAARDGNGHGTHVTGIAAGSDWHGLTGVADQAELLIVRTDFINTDLAVQWIFQEAEKLGRPCVVNLSLGHHFGPHDGTEAEEEAQAGLVGSGRIIVVAAGNSRRSNAHASHDFVDDERLTVPFNIALPSRPTLLPGIGLTFWHDRSDEIRVALITPWGEEIDFPEDGTESWSIPGVTQLMRLTRKFNPFSNDVQLQVELDFTTRNPSVLANWMLRFEAGSITFGHIDGWVSAEDRGSFQPGPCVDPNSTVSMPATGRRSIAVGSFVSKREWASDLGNAYDRSIIEGRASPFSSLGPTRDGRHKPEISAPGQYVTAALADKSELAQSSHRVRQADRLVTIEGTSMATPLVTGAIALMLQKNGDLIPEQIVEIFTNTAIRDRHSGRDWSPAYGSGKLDLCGALAALG